MLFIILIYLYLYVCTFYMFIFIFRIGQPSARELGQRSLLVLKTSPLVKGAAGGLNQVYKNGLSRWIFVSTTTSH